MRFGIRLFRRRIFRTCCTARRKRITSNSPFNMSELLRALEVYCRLLCFFAPVSEIPRLQDAFSDYRVSPFGTGTLVHVSVN